MAAIKTVEVRAEARVPRIEVSGGLPGSPGIPGNDGISVTGASIDGSGHLILSFSSGPDVDVGLVVGTNGTDGTDGVDGISITGASIDGSGHLILTFSSGPPVDVGDVTGTDGTNGADGVSVIGASVDGSYHLILTLSDSSTIDAGYVRGPAGSGTGDVVGPAGATNGNLASYNGTTGKLIGEIAPSALPISTATQTALDLKRTTYADKATAATATVGTAAFIELQAYSTAVLAWRGGATYRLAVDATEYTNFPTELKFTTADSKKFVAAKLDDAWGAGVRGDGSTDDYAALQAYIWFCGYTGEPVIIPDSPNDFRISQKLVFKTTRNLTATDTTPGSDVHFTDMLPFTVVGQGKAKIVATAAMTSMFEFISDTTDSDIGPFYTTVSNIQLDGNSLATACIKSDYTMHLSVQKCRLHAATRGIEWVGYGVSRIRDNVIRCKYGVYLLGGGGDSCISNNDFYSQEATSACIYLGYYGGNMEIRGNIFSNDQGFTGATYCIQLAGTTASGSEEIRHVNILNNEFSGFPTAIRADGKNSTTKNVWNCTVRDNHVTSNAGGNYGSLMDAVDCTEFVVSGNHGNSTHLADATAKFIALVRCDKFRISDNLIARYEANAMAFTGCEDCEVVNNTFNDIGKLGSSYVNIILYGACLRNRFVGNKFSQSSASYAQNGIYEDGSGTADYTSANDNDFNNMTKPYTKLGANSVMRRVQYLTAAPASGYHYAGDIAWNTAPSAGGAPGWVCTTSGSPGTFKAMANVAA